jgi:hypothetical protein
MLGLNGLKEISLEAILFLNFFFWIVSFQAYPLPKQNSENFEFDTINIQAYDDSRYLNLLYPLAFKQTLLNPKK